MPRTDVHGFLLLDKPFLYTSNRALQKLKWIFAAKKAGHTGCLDPLATGMLPICFGAATKYARFFLDATKQYHVVAQLGLRTNSYDADGQIIETKPIPAYFQSEIERFLKPFRGTIEQTPPIFSAIKHQGKPIYKLARKGIEHAVQPRQVHIHELEITDYQYFDPQTAFLTLKVTCSKGTYIRSLVDDIGQALGCGAYVSQLRRISVDPFLDREMVSMETLISAKEADNQHRLLWPIDTALQGWPKIVLEPGQPEHVLKGLKLMLENPYPIGWTRLLNPEGQFIGMGQVNDDGKCSPRIMLSEGQFEANSRLYSSNLMQELGFLC